MSDRSKIEWTDATWNPVTGCTKVSPGCDHCYAETLAERFRGTPGHYYEHGFDVQLRPEKLDQPLRWRRPRRVFVNSMSDLFHDAVPDKFIAHVWAIMAAADQHTFQVLTKRHGRMRSLLTTVDFWRMVSYRLEDMGIDAYPSPLDLPPNVWVGVSVEDQKRADLRIPGLLDTPAAVRFLSCEPLLGRVDLSRWLTHDDECASSDDPPWCTCTLEHRRGDPYFYKDRIDWVIVGGESGRDARPMHPEWARTLRDQCQTAGVPFHFKQWGEWGLQGWRVDPTATEMKRMGKRNSGRELDGRTWDEFPRGDF